MIRHLLAACALLLSLAGSGQIGYYKWAFGYNSASTQKIKVNGNNDVFVAINNGVGADADPTPYFYGLDATGGSGSVVRYDQNNVLAWGAAFTSSVGLGFSINSIYVDQSSFVYIVGTYEGSVDADPGPGVMNLTSAGSTDICIIKLTQSGQLVWARSIGSTSDDNGKDISADNSGNVLVGGNFKLTIDADPGAGVANITSNGNMDALVLKLDAAGNYLWAFNLGGTSYDDLNKIIGYGSDVYAFGTFYNTVDFDPGTASSYTMTNSSFSGYMAKYTGAGNFVKAKQVSGSNLEILDADINANNTLVISGNYQGVLDANPSGPSYTLSASGYREGFIAKYDTALQVQWAITTRGGISNYYSDCFFYGVETDSLQNIYVTGNYAETMDFDPSAGVYTFTTTGVSNETDALVLKYSPAGALIGGFKFGNGNSQFSRAIALDKHLQYYIGGSTTGTTDYDPAAATATLSFPGFYAKYGPLSSKTNTLNISICHGQSYTLNSTTYSHAGSYQEVFYLANGNDSIVYLNLTVKDPNTNVVDDNQVLKSQAPAGSAFQWIDCTTHAAIGGATSYSYAPQGAGPYAVKVTYNGCTDTTNCLQPSSFANAGVPNLNWAYLYGGNWGTVRSVTTDQYKNVYVTGSFANTMDIDLSANEKDIQSYNTSVDIFLTKYDNNGTLLWSVPIGTTSASTTNEISESIEVDDQQNVYITGTFEISFDMDPGPGVAMVNDASAGCCDKNVFFAKLNANGQLVWAKGIGCTGGGEVHVEGMALDRSGNIAISGYFSGILDADPGPGTMSFAGGNNALSQGYLAKYDNNGALLSAMSFTTNISGIENETHSVAFDHTGNMVVCGSFSGPMDFDPSASTYTINSSGSTTLDIFYAKYSPSMQLIWAKRMGITNVNDKGGSLICDPRNNFYMTGKGGLVGPGQDFAARFDSAGALLNSYSFSVGTDPYYVSKLALDAGLNVYTTGVYAGTLNIGSGTINSAGGNDIYVAKFANTGAIDWGFHLSSPGTEYVGSVAVDYDGNVFLTGAFADTVDFDPSSATVYTLAAQPGGNSFFAKYGQGCAPVNTGSSAGTGYIAASAHNSFYIWKNCSTNQVVASTTTNTFYPTSPGQYKAVIYQGNCVDSTSCQTVNVITTGIEAHHETDIALYPVPASDHVYIDAEQDVMQVKLYDINGRLCYDSHAFDNRRHAQLSLSGLKEGVYMAEILLEDHTVARKKIIRSGQ